MKRDLLTVAALWLVLTAIGEVLAAVGDFYPLTRSDKGEEIETAFRVLVFFAIPVFAMVVAVLFYSVLRRRTAGPPTEDGPALQGRGPVPLAWFGITAALTLAIMIYPGLTGIPRIFGDEPHPDLTVEVEAVQWAWLVSYPQYDITAGREMVLPVDRTVEFKVTSRDVLHSFWIPAFLMKIDAVPGMTTTISLRPTQTGSFQEDPLLRVQCAELCGLSHSRMQLPVRVVTEQEFADWVKERQGAARAALTPQPGAAAGAQEVAIVGENLLFDTDEIAVEAGRRVVIRFENRDAGVPHNWALYESEEAASGGVAPLAVSPIEPGPIEQEIVFDAPEPGTYFFRCDVHPTTMTGELVVR